jgi:tyrosyl-tRNA synthetase
MNCTCQIAGSDQYGNIVAGIDLIRREFGAEAGQAYGVTAPLVTRSDGAKMSKSTGTAIWMSADTEDRTSPYAFYQYFINLPDADVEQWLKWYTLLEREAIADIVQRHEKAPHERIGQRELAREMTALVHGGTERDRVEAASQALFSGDVRRLDEEMLGEVFADVPGSTHDKSLLEGDGLSLVELLPQTTLASSKREARQFLGDGAVAVNGDKAAADGVLTAAHLLHGRTILLRRGKKRWHATQWQ